MHPTSPQVDSELLILRLWREVDNDGREEWCGKVQHVLSGRAYTFHGLPSLIDLLDGLGAQGEDGNRRTVSRNASEGAQEAKSDG